MNVVEVAAGVAVILPAVAVWTADIRNAARHERRELDERKRRLLIARDPFGIKPIYYKIKDGSVWFGSEIRTILATAKDNPEPDPTALNLFLRYRFTPSPYTVFKGISKLAAGTMLVFEDGKSSQRRWYRSNPRPFSPMKSEAEAREELLERYGFYGQPSFLCRDGHKCRSTSFPWY